MTKSLIDISGVTKRYQLGEQVVFALNGINLNIEKGEYAALMGPSGSGKEHTNEYHWLLRHTYSFGRLLA